MRTPLLIVACGAVFALFGGYGFVQAASSNDPFNALFTLVFVAVGALLMLAGIAHARIAHALGRLASKNRIERVATNGDVSWPQS